IALGASGRVGGHEGIGGERVLEDLRAESRRKKKRGDQREDPPRGDSGIAPAQRALAPWRSSTNSLNRRTPTPVGPLTRVASSRSVYAVPAMSRWAHGNPSTNSRRNQPAEMLPAGRPPLFFTSAMSDLLSSR